jgi:hypothetical protein
MSVRMREEGEKGKGGRHEESESITNKIPRFRHIHIFHIPQVHLYYT